MFGSVLDVPVGRSLALSALLISNVFLPELPASNACRCLGKPNYLLLESFNLLFICTGTGRRSPELLLLASGLSIVLSSLNFRFFVVFPGFPPSFYASTWSEYLLVIRPT